MLSACFPGPIDVGTDITVESDTGVTDSTAFEEATAATDAASTTATADSDAADADVGCSESCDDHIPCTVDFCVEGVCAHTDTACACKLDSECKDDDLCDAPEKCGPLRTCIEVGEPTTCQKPESPCQQNTCVPATGTCKLEAANEGADCDDEQACTDDDKCVSGECEGTSKVCNDNRSCTPEGTCNPESGECEYDVGDCECDVNADCDDNKPCNGVESCGTDGKCHNGTAVTCEETLDACRVNTCNPTSGQCEEVHPGPEKSCNDHDPCTTSSHCEDGQCVGVVECGDGIQCTVDSCTPGTGQCVHDKSACECTSDAGCDDGETCNGVETCDSSTLSCTNPADLDDGDTCDDDDRCTKSDHCTSGKCGGAPVVCESTDPCREDGACIPETGECSSPSKPDTTPCDDGNLCTLDDKCQDGSCVRVDVVCQALDVCHVAGQCNPTTGACSDPVAPPTTGCDDGEYCTVTDRCANGSCVGTGLPDNEPLDWNTIAKNPSAVGLAKGANGDVWVAFVMNTQSATNVGPTGSGGTLSLSLDGDEAAGFALGHFDAQGALVSLHKLVTALGQGSAVMITMADFDGGFVVRISTPGAAVRLANGQTRVPGDNFSVVYDDSGVLRSWVEVDSANTMFVGTAIPGAGSFSALVVQYGGDTFSVRNSSGTTLTSSTAPAQLLIVSLDGTFQLRAIPGAPDIAGVSVFEGTRRDGKDYFWYSFVGTQSWGPWELTNTTMKSTVFGSVDELGQVRYAVALPANGPVTMWCDVVADQLVCIQRLDQGAYFFDESGPIQTIAAAGVYVYAIGASGNIAWIHSLNLGTDRFEPLAIDVNGDATRVMGIQRNGPLEFDGQAIPNTGPNANAMNTLVVELTSNGDLAFARAAASCPVRFFGALNRMVSHPNGAMTLLGEGDGLVTVGIDVQESGDYAERQMFLSRVNSAGALSCD